MTAGQDPTPTSDETQLPALRREALTTTERRTGLGSVALLCSLAGIASGFALATTLVAAQLAQGGRTCQAPTVNWTVVEARAPATAVAPAAPAFLGVHYTTRPDGAAQVLGVVRGSGAQAAGIRAGDLIRSFEGETIDEGDELRRLVRASVIGETALVTFERDGATQSVTATLGAEPRRRLGCGGGGQ